MEKAIEILDKELRFQKEKYNILNEIDYMTEGFIEGIEHCHNLLSKQKESNCKEMNETQKYEKQEPREEKYLGKCLDEAKKVICGERQDSYGNPEDSFKSISVLWDNYLLEKFGFLSSLKEIDVANMMILFKMARLNGQKPTRDTYLDICGYAAIAADSLMEQKNNGTK